MTKKAEKIEVIKNNELSYDAKTIIVILTLILVYPVGVVLMLMWMDWNKWLKILLAIPLVICCIVPIILIILAAAMFFKIGDNLTQPETIREIKEIIEVIPTEMATKSGEGTISPTIRVIRK